MREQLNVKKYSKALSDVFASIRETFPFQTRSEYASFEKNCKKFQRIIERDSADGDFFNHLKDFLLTLGNGHTKLGSYPTKEILYRPVNYMVARNTFGFFLVDLKKKGELHKILTIDGKKASVLFADYYKRDSKSLSSQHAEYLILKYNLLSSPLKKPARVIVSERGIKRELRLKRIRGAQEEISSAVSFQKIDSDIALVKVARWINTDEFSRQIENVVKRIASKNIKGLIVDVRDNMGGDANMAAKFSAHFFRRKVAFGHVLTRSTKSQCVDQETTQIVLPRKPYIDIPVAVTVNSGCWSSNEYFVAGMKDNHRACIVGEKTGGGSGNPKKFEIPFGEGSFSLFVSTWVYCRPNGKKLEKKGIEPDVVVTPHVADMATGRDIVLERATTVLRART